MFVVIWEYQVRPDLQKEFETVYAEDGAWAEFFRQDTGYLGTQLLRDTQLPHRYLTIDRWTSQAEYEAFLTQWQAEYTALDARCADLTEQESPLGTWTSS
jgi:heme-degrading monooxygenase HmoA